MSGNDSYTVSLLHMNGANNGTSFLDHAIGGTHAWTAAGGAKTVTAQSKFGGSSGVFDGTGDNITTAGSTNFAFGSGAFTIDAWIMINAVPGTNQIMDLLTNGAFATAPYGGFEFGLRDYSGVLNFYIVFFNGTDGTVLGAANQAPGVAFSTGVWTHIAAIRSGNNIYFAKNGALGSAVGFTATQTDNNNTLNFAGASRSGRLDYNGWANELRISKGIARWTANFTPMTMAYNSLVEKASGAWKNADLDKVLVGGVWKSVAEAKLLVGGAWKQLR